MSLQVADHDDDHFVLKIFILAARFSWVPAVIMGLFWIAACFLADADLQTAFVVVGFNVHVASTLMAAGAFYLQHFVGKHMVQNAAPQARLVQSAVHAKLKAGARRLFFQSAFLGFLTTGHIVFVLVSCNFRMARKYNSAVVVENLMFMNTVNVITILLRKRPHINTHQVAAAPNVGVVAPAVIAVAPVSAIPVGTEAPVTLPTVVAPHPS